MSDSRAQRTELRRKLENLESLRGVLDDEAFERARAELESELQALVDTGGGALITGSVSIAQGDFVGRDKWHVVLGDQYVGLPPDQIPPDALLAAYLRMLAADCRRLPLGVVDPRFLQTGASQPVPLSDVYVDLDVLAPVREEQEQSEHLVLGRLLRGESGERTPLVEAIAHERVTHFVLLGDAGSGKTTFVNYLAYALAAEDAVNLLPEDSPLRGLLPARLVLRDVAARCIPADATRGQAQMLWDALHADLVTDLGQAAADALFPLLQGRLLEEGGLLLLDGLDEVPMAGRRRQCLLEAIADLATALPPGRGRVVVTARPYAYADPEWRLPGFETLVLAPFSDEQVQHFVTRWYRAVRPAMGWDEALAQDRAGQLQGALGERPYLADLATRPLLLTLMATLHTSWGQLPQDRADLYEETVKLLLSRWQRMREVKGPDGETVVEPGIAEVLAADETAVRAALHHLAFQVHEGQAEGEDREARPADIREEEVLLALTPLLKQGVAPHTLLRYLEMRAGLLVGRAPGVYAFPHRSFQEYLAACHLADGAEFAAELRKRVWSDPGWWREVFLMGVGKAKQGGLGNAVHVVNTLVPEGPREVKEKTEQHWQAATLAGQALLDLRFPDQAEGKPDFSAVLKRVRRWLVALLETPGVMTPRQRAAAGDVLSQLGDPRPGVGVIIAEGPPSPEHRERGTGGEGLVPDILWVEIPAGPFLMGSPEGDEQAWDDERPQHTLDLPAFLIARYPITNAQYRPFVEAGGYDEPRFWTEEGWAWRNGELDPDFLPLDVMEDEEFKRRYIDWVTGRTVVERSRPYYWNHPRWGLANRPVVGVTWYEALAYCRWLTEALQNSGDARLPHPSDSIVRLPSEAEWEKAARGTGGHRWPWGDEWQEHAANTKEAGIEETSTVGAFPDGASPYGVMDVAGNVWEWTRSKWGLSSVARPDYAYPYDPDDGREGQSGLDWRVVRGGSWNFNEGIRPLRVPLQAHP
jgi:formylglycine-generating enzyme required for sulfatase activity